MKPRRRLLLLLLGVAFSLLPRSSAAERYSVGNRVIVFPTGRVQGADAKVGLFKVVDGAPELLREIHQADWPLAVGDCGFGSCSAAEKPEFCGGRCLRGVPELLLLDRVFRRAIVEAEVSDEFANRPHVLFVVNLENGDVARVGIVEASLLVDPSISRDGRFLSLVKHYRGSADAPLDYIDLQTGASFTDALLFAGRFDPATEYRQVTGTAWLDDGTLAVVASIGRIDRDVDPPSGEGAVLRRLRLVYDPRNHSVVSAAPLP